MNAEIIAVGTELLLGQIANTNAQYLSRRLSELGIDVYNHAVVGDNPQRIKEALALAESRADVIVTTGGLGPTLDDITKETIADYYGLKMVKDEASVKAIDDFFAAIKRPVIQNNYKQAYIPEGSIVLYNGVGTAPGSIVESNGKVVVILPGPPSEMQNMFETHVFPYLEQKTGYRLKSRIIRLFGIGESMVASKLNGLIEKQSNPTLATYVDDNGVYLRLTAKSNDSEEIDSLLSAMEQEIMNQVGENVYGYDSDNLASVIIKEMNTRGLKLGICESCTGGMLASKIVTIPGASDVLTEGVVAYANEAKINRLGVSEETLKEFGAVSSQTATEMAKGLLANGLVDIAVSTTGIAGPGGGSADKPVGLVYVCVADKNHSEVHEFRFNKKREQIMITASANAMYAVIRFINKYYK